MTDAQRAALCLFGRLLAYPDAAFMEALPGMALEAESLTQSGDDAFAATVADFTRALLALGQDRAAQEYVATFDHASAASLYMAWHRYGNDRSQGKAMAALNGLYRTAGFEPVQGCMPDYLPRMLEFLAIAPDWAGEALLDGFGPEITGVETALLELQSPWAPLFQAGLAPLRAQYPELFKPRSGPDPTRRPMARPEPEADEAPSGPDSTRADIMSAQE